MVERLANAPHALIVGGGGTGAAVAHDLALRGVRVTLVERAELTSGTTGRHHGLFHSGARYAVKDRESAVECIEENRILRRIAPGSFELNDGLFVAVTDEEADYEKRFSEACEASGIPHRRLEPSEALRLEPLLNPELRCAVQIPDGTMDAMRLPLRFFATALANGATVLPFTEVVDLTRGDAARGKTVTGAVVVDHTTERRYEIGADIVISAAGPWAGRVAALAGVDVPVQPSPGILVAVKGRFCNMVINRLHESGDGDIVVPQRELSVIGTSSWLTDDPDHLAVPQDHVETMFREGSMLIPSIREAEMRASWSAARPLLGERGAASGRELSRTFKCFDHEAEDGLAGFVTISGGKATTLRAMAEATADLVCRKLGVERPCQTRETVLLPHTAYYA